MATIGELMDALRGKGDDADPIRPEGTGTHSYVGGSNDSTEEIVGTYEPTVVMDQDDIPDSVKEKARDFLYAKTSGEGDLREANYWPVGDDEIKEYTLMDQDGKPTKTKPAYGFTGTFEEALKDAITVFEAEGSFFGTTVRHGEDLLRKSAQEDGHGLLLDESGDLASRINDVLEEAHPASRTTVKPVGGGQDRFSRGYYSPDSSFNTDKDAGTPGTQHYGKQSPVTARTKSEVGGYTPDRPYISEDDMPSTFLNRDPMIGTAETTRWDAAPWKDLDSWSSQWDSIEGDGFEAWEEKYEYAQNLVSMLQTHNKDHPDDWYLGKQSFIMALILKVLFELLSIGLGALIGLAPFPNIGNRERYDSNDQMEFGSSWKRKEDYVAPPPPPGGFLDAVAGAVGDALGGLFGDDGQDRIETVMGMLGLPIPWNTISVISEDYDNFLEGLVTEFFSLMGDYVGADETMINYLRPIMNHFITLFTDLEKWRPPQTDNILALPDMYLYMFSKSPVIRFLRAMFNVCEGYFASGGKDGVAEFSPIPRKDGTNYYGNWSSHPKTRALRSRTMDHDPETGAERNKWIAAQSIQKLPSMYLLPASLNTALGLATGWSMQGAAPYLRTNYDTSPFAWDLINNSAFAGQDQLAVVSKAGVPYHGGNRFSSDEVNFIENMLEAELLPFYIQDLRTNEVIAFHAFLSSLSDSFSPSFKATSGFGRIEDVQIYEKTTRAIGVTFTMAAMVGTDLDELYWKLNKLTTMIYPQWSKGTMMEGKMSDGEPVKFRQPFSQIPTATPVVRLRVGDLIRSNYSKLNMMNLFGAQDAEFMTGDLEAYQEDIKAGIMAKQIASVKKGVMVTPVKEPGVDGKPDDSKGWPVGSKIWVYLKTKNRNAINETKLPNAKKWAYSYKYGKYFRKRAFECEIVEYVDTSGNYGTGKDQHQTVGVKVKYVAGQEPKGKNTSLCICKSSKDRDTGIISYDEIDMSQFNKMFNANFDLLASERSSWMETDLKLPEKLSSVQEKADAIFSADTNPYFKSFESSMGRGLAGIINSLSFNYKLNEAPWETEFGSRGPTMIEVTLGFTPIHDIQPGLDAQGGNRAPVFPIKGAAFNNDSWTPTITKKNGMIDTIQDDNFLEWFNDDMNYHPDGGNEED